MHFWKYCGAGNDFVILENFDGSIAPERYAALAAALCREHFSVGADGLMVLEPPAQGGDCRMRFYNRDGSTAEMCGNGARAVQLRQHNGVRDARLAQLQIGAAHALRLNVQANDARAVQADAVAVGCDAPARDKPGGRFDALHRP